MKERANIPELMDDPSLSVPQLKAALKDVTLVNRFLGGQNITLDGLDYFLKKYPQPRYTIADMGCGDGAILRAMAIYCRKKGVKANLIGLDLNPKSLALGREYSKGFPEIDFVQQDLLELDRDTFHFDIVTSTLTMHHFTNAEILDFLKCFGVLANLGWIVNDLHRSRLAAVLFRAFSTIFMKTHIARHDGLISIKRAFLKDELTSLATQLNLEDYSITWRWAFRYLWITDNKAQK